MQQLLGGKDADNLVVKVPTKLNEDFLINTAYFLNLKVYSLIVQVKYFYL